MTGTGTGAPDDRRPAPETGPSDDVASPEAVPDTTDPDGDTAEIPAVPSPRDHPSATLWLVAGAVVGIVALVLFTGGLGGSGDPDTVAPAGPPVSPDTGATGSTGARAVGEGTPTTATPARSAEPSGTTAPRATTTAADATSAGTPETTTPATAPGTGTTADAAPGAEPAAFTLTLDGKRPVFIVVRRRSEKGDQVFAGTVGDGVTKRLTSTTPLWVNVAWAPNARIAIDGRAVPTTGGTEYYLARASGLRRVTGDG